MPRIQGTTFPSSIPSIPYTGLISTVYLPGISISGDWTTDTLTSYQWKFTNEVIDKIYLETTKTYKVGIASSRIMFSFPLTGTMDFYADGNNNTGTLIASVSTDQVNVGSGVVLSINGKPVLPIEYTSISSLNNLNTKTYQIPLVQNAEPSRFTLWLGYVGTNGATFPAIQLGYSNNTFISGTYYGVHAGMNTAAWMGATLDIWSNSWSTSHSITGQWVFINCGIIPGKAQPNRMWVIHGLMSRWDTTFSGQLSATVYSDSTKIVDRIKVFTDIFDRFNIDAGVNKFSDASLERE